MTLNTGKISLKWKFTVVAAAQILFLAFIAFSRFWTIQAGETVLLKTVPVDPRDLMMGDYVSLEYEINRLPAGIFQPEGADISRGVRPNKAVYVVLKPQGNYHVAAEAYLRKPSSLNPGEVLIKGKYLFGLDREVRVIYGIERFYVPEGKGMEIERPPNQTGRQQLDVEVKVGTGGNAVIRRVFVNGEEMPFS
ncbi:MAG: hypothetical protein C4589_01480 [Peptococcaceae bacterium]|nr:MAG: hypothetical protein C4589_01480 [Peptococcaceae bacterium]